MGLLDLVGQVLGEHQQTAPNSASGGGMGDVLMQLLAGQGQNQNQNQAGGLPGLIDQFRNSGLGHIAESWVSDGPNQSVSPQQLRTVFGDEQVQSMSEQAGMAPNNFLSQLSQHLPRVVDRATPDGQVPNEGTISV